jgi:hypothetical protein
MGLLSDTKLVLSPKGTNRGMELTMRIHSVRWSRQLPFALSCPLQLLEGGTFDNLMFKMPFFMETLRKMFTCDSHQGMRINTLLTMFASWTRHSMA